MTTDTSERGMESLIMRDIIGVGVEGPSDLQFWHKVLHKHFRGHKFDVRNMKNRDKLIREGSFSGSAARLNHRS